MAALLLSSAMAGLHDEREWVGSSSGSDTVDRLACIMAQRQGIIAPTINYREFNPNCDLDVVPNEARQARVRAAMSNAFAFGGMNAVLVLQAV